MLNQYVSAPSGMNPGIMPALMAELSALGACPVDAEGLDRAVNCCDVLVLSPGIPIDNSLPVAFRRQGKNIVSQKRTDLQSVLFFR